MLGEEMLATQGVTIKDYPNLRQFSDRVLADLAGNAFNAAAVAWAILSGLSVIQLRL